MSELPGGADFFARIPLFREFARLLGSDSGPVNWELARQVAVATAAGAESILGAASGGSAPAAIPQRAPGPAERTTWDERLRLAELWIEPVTTVPSKGLTISARPVTPADWAERILPAFAPMVEPLARRLSEGPGAAGAVPAELADLSGRIGSLLFGMQVGTGVGQLAQQVLTQFDVPLPAADPAVALVVSDNVAAFATGNGLPADQVGLWLAAHDLLAHRLFHGVPWLPDYLTGLARDVAERAVPDGGELLGRLQSLDLSHPERLAELLESQGGLLGAEPTPAQLAVLHRLEVLLALVEGYCRTLAHRALDHRLPELASIERAARSRGEQEGSVRSLFCQLVGIDAGRAAGQRGEAFCAEALAATDVDRLDRVWAHPDFLPTDEELSSPERWLERAGIIGAGGDLDADLRRLLDDTGEPGEPGEAGEAG